LFLDAIQQLVDNGTITAAEGQTVDREIQQGRVDTQTLSGSTQAQLAAVRQALRNTKRRERALDGGGEGVINDAGDVRAGAGNPRRPPA
jgi:hypothetical protein